MRSYSKYKSSGNECIGEIPVDWEIKRLKLAVEVINGSTPSSSNVEYWDGNIVWVTPSDISKLESNLINFSERQITTLGLENCGARLVPSGSVILTTRAPIGNLAITGTELCTNQGCKSLVPKSCSEKYLFYYLGTITTYLQEIGTGTTFKELSNDALKNIIVPFPSPSEQTNIAAFLDSKTSQIDTLIRNKQKLIELLKEERAAIINHAVTKGINPNAKMKDSGVEWLGVIPAQWDVIQFKRLTKRVEVGIAEAATQAYMDEGVPILRAKNIKGGLVKGELLHIDPAFADKNSSKKIFAGDIVTVRTGNAGLSAVLPDHLNECQCFTMLISTLKHGFVPDFYCYLLNSNYGMTYFELTAWGTAQKNISVPILQEFIVPKLREEEQREIVNYINSETLKLDNVLAKVEREIDLLEEYRTAMISEVVTGKVCVV